MTVARAPLDHVRAVAHRHRATVNDVVLTAVGGALRATLEGRAEHVTEFVVGVPVAARVSATAQTLGNRFSETRVVVPGAGDRLDRLEQVVDAVAGVVVAGVVGDCAAVTVLSVADPDDVLTSIADHARDIADADDAFVLLPGDDRDTLRVGAACGTNAARLLGTEVEADGTFIGSVLRGGEVVEVREDTTSPRRLFGELPGGPLMLVPLTGSHARGVLGVCRAGTRMAFSRVVTEVLVAFANQAAVALELAERRRDAERLSVYEDRGRIARDLHDLVIQRLFATGMALEGAGYLVEDDPKGMPGVHRKRHGLNEFVQSTDWLSSALHQDTPRHVLLNPVDLEGNRRPRR